ncbi:expressed unknown protein [Seminavis robusta]|uniref:Uncharacterized protein n=1 Tax=Seminavis robusta TaxID=568900 RepID=A0A9N8EAP0_9STRA|nr:expressed unknown protein [Seminavis robusta]|eukprot:Sro734_g194610.1 n/a (164) ;mRNA; r:2828-3463
MFTVTGAHKLAAAGSREGFGVLAYYRVNDGLLNKQWIRTDPKAGSITGSDSMSCRSYHRLGEPNATAHGTESMFVSGMHELDPFLDQIVKITADLHVPLIISDDRGENETDSIIEAMDDDNIAMHDSPQSRNNPIVAVAVVLTCCTVLLGAATLAVRRRIWKK